MPGPDPKPLKERHRNRPRRIVDPAAVKRALLTHPWCAACGDRAANGHHVIGKGQHGDDVEANIVGLCGSGAMGCHGALHGNPYVVRIAPDPRSITQFATFEERRDADWVRRRIGATIDAYRPDVIAYVLDKLGLTPGLDYLFRTYHLSMLLPSPEDK